MANFFLNIISFKTISLSVFFSSNSRTFSRVNAFQHSALSLWSSAKPAESDDRSKGIPNYAKVIEDSDLMYNMYLIDNAYNILKK